jgi:predicted porin
MRKVLLATTALVAMSVTGAHADISISMTAETGFITSDKDGDSAWMDGNLTVTGSMTSDNGLTFTAVKNMAFQNDTPASYAGDDKITEDAYIEVSGDFGGFRIGQTDMAGDRMDGVLGKNKDVYTIGATSTSSTHYGTDITDFIQDTSISYVSPSMNGLTVYGGAVPNGQSQMGVNFSLGGMALMIQQQSGATTSAGAAIGDEVSVGAGFSVAGIGINVGKKQEDNNGTKTDSSDLNLAYSLNDSAKMTVLLQEGKQSGAKHTSTGVEIAYTIAPGATAYIGYESTDKAGDKDSGMGAVLSVSF